MKIAQSAEFLESVANHPQVRPWLGEDGGPERIELAPLMAEGIGFEFDTGGWFLHGLGDGVYEAHTLFLPGSKDVLTKCLDVIRLLFCGTDCTRIVTKVPADNIAADRLTLKAGFRLDHEQPDAYLRGGVRHAVRYYSLALDDWMRGIGPRQFAAVCADLGNEEKGRRALRRWAVMHNDFTVLED